MNFSFLCGFSKFELVPFWAPVVDPQKGGFALHHRALRKRTSLWVVRSWVLQRGCLRNTHCLGQDAPAGLSRPRLPGRTEHPDGGVSLRLEGRLGSPDVLYSKFTGNTH